MLYAGRVNRLVLAEMTGGPAPTPPQTWTAMVRAACAPGSPAVIGPDGVVDYGSLLRMSAAAVELLGALGLPAGSAVPALLDAGPLAYALWIGGACSRHPIAPVAPRSPIPERAAGVGEHDAHVVLPDPANAAVAGALAGA